MLVDLDAFALDSDDDSSINSSNPPSVCNRQECLSVSSNDSEESEYSSFDDLLDSMTAVSVARGHPNKRQRTGTHESDMRPIAFVRFNTRKGKAKPVLIKALLDSGASESLVISKYTKKLSKKKGTTGWSTPSGGMTTKQTVKAQFTIPELQDDKLIEWKLHVTESLGHYDMIIGRDIMSFLGIDISFSKQEITWEPAAMPFKDVEATPLDSYHIEDPDGLMEDTERLKKILDAKYEKADLEQVCAAQKQLSKQQQDKLHALLSQFDDLFDGTLGVWKGTQVKLELKEGVTPYHAKAYPIPKCHEATLRSEVERLCKIGVLKKKNSSEWAAPSFIIPKKDKTVRFINDFRELNKRIKRRPYPIPHIQDMLLNLEGFQYATSLDLNMGYYHIELCPESKKLCTLVFPFGKYEMQRLPMGLCNSPDIFQEKMSELMDGLEFVRTYIDDLLVLTKGSFEDHLEKLERVLQRLRNAGLRVNGNKSFFARQELEYLGYWITRDGIKPLPAKVQAIMKLAEPKNRKELRSFIGIVNYYRDMWLRRSHVLAPLASLTSKKAKWVWGEAQQKAFATAKKVIAREVLLAYPDFSKKFTIHTDASHYQLGAVISQEGKPIAFYSRKLNPAQTRYTTTERELLSIVETLKEYRTILLGHEIEVFTDHKNLVYKHFNTERVMRWRLLIEEFGPTLTYIKGANNIVADALSRMAMTEADFSEEAFAADDVADFPINYPLSYKEIAHWQAKDKEVQKLLKEKPEQYKVQEYTHSDYTYRLVTRDNKILLPKKLQRKGVEWYHSYLLHQGETRTELTMGQHYCWKGMRKTVTQVCKACVTCREFKKRQSKYGKLPPKPKADAIPWHTLCIDLIGPYQFGKGKEQFVLHCLTMIDPATGWFEIVQIPNKKAEEISNLIETTWLTRYPWPTEIVMDRGREFCAEVKDMLRDDYPFKRKVITTRNPQANSVVERVHQVVHNMIRTHDAKVKADFDNDKVNGILAAVRAAVLSAVHTTNRATPMQLVFGRDALLNISFEADWQYIKERKQRRILQNNRRENSTRRDHTYSPGDKVMVRLNPSRKHGEPQFAGPYDVVQVFDNGTVKLSKATASGAVFETWNIRNVDPCMA